MDDDTTRRHDRDDRDVRPSRRGFLAGSALLGAGALAFDGRTALAASAERLFQTAQVAAPETRLRVRIRNEGASHEASTGDSFPVVFSPGAYAVHARGEPIITDDEPERDNGLEEVAEDGAPGRLGESLATRDFVTDAGVFDTPAGGDGPGPLTPGNSYEFEVTAGGVSRYRSLASMFVPSNDLFVAFGDAGLNLFGADGPVSGDVTDRLGVWDAGTEENEEPGVGPNQAPRQSGPDTGPAEDGVVRELSEVDDGDDYPAASDVVRVTITPDE